MKTFSFLTEVATHPDDNTMFIPEGWNGVLYNDDCNDPDNEYVRESSLPKKGEFVMAYLDDRSTDIFVWIRNKARAEKQQTEYDPRRFVLCEYAGIDDGQAIWYNLNNTLQIDKAIERNARAMYALTELVVAWHPIEFPKMPN